MIKQLIQYVPPFLTDCMQTGNAMKQREINMILSNNAATSNHGESFINLKILDVGKCVYMHIHHIYIYIYIHNIISVNWIVHIWQSFNSINC